MELGLSENLNPVLLCEHYCKSVLDLGLTNLGTRQVLVFGGTLSAAYYDTSTEGTFTTAACSLLVPWTGWNLESSSRRTIIASLEFQ